MVIFRKHIAVFNLEIKKPTIPLNRFLKLFKIQIAYLFLNMKPQTSGSKTESCPWRVFLILRVTSGVAMTTDREPKLPCNCPLSHVTAPEPAVNF